MTIKTVRFNAKEESMLKRVMSVYKADFSTCVKHLIEEKLEDFADVQIVKKIKEGKTKDYFSAEAIDKLF